MKLFRSKSFYRIVFVFLLFILPFVLIPFNKIVYANDWEFMGLNPIKQGLFYQSAWSYYSQYYNLFEPRYFIGSIFLSIYSIIHNFSIYQKFIIAIIFVLQYLSISSFISLFKSKNYLLTYYILPIVYMFNFYTLINWQFGYLQILLIYTVLPYFFAQTYKLFSNNNTNYSKIFAVIKILYILPFFSVIFPDISPFLSILIIYSTLLIIYFFKYNLKGKLFIIGINLFFLAIFIFFNLYWLINYILFWTSSNNLNLVNTVSNINFFINNFHYSTPYYFFKGFGWLLTDNYGRYYVDFMGTVNNSLLLNTLSTFVYSVQFIIFTILERKNKRIIVAMFLLILIMILLSSGFNEPFGVVNRLLYQIGIYKFLRDAYIKVMIIWWIPYVILFYYWLQFLLKKSKIVFTIVVSLNLLIFLLPLFSNQYFNYRVIEPYDNKPIVNKSLISIPKFYSNIENKFNGYKDINAILYLPIGDVYYDYNWGYGGAAIAKYFLPVDHNIYGEYNSIDQIKKIENGNIGALFNTNINYIIYDKTYNISFLGNEKTRKLNSLIHALNTNNNIHKLVQDRDYTIYKLSNNSTVVGFNRSGNSFPLNNSLVGPSEYKVNIGNKNIKMIKFYNNFDSNWILTNGKTSLKSKRSNDGYNEWILSQPLKSNQITYIKYKYQIIFDALKFIPWVYYLVLTFMLAGVKAIYYKKEKRYDKK